MAEGQPIDPGCRFKMDEEQPSSLTHNARTPAFVFSGGTGRSLLGNDAGYGDEFIPEQKTFISPIPTACTFRPKAGLVRRVLE